MGISFKLSKAGKRYHSKPIPLYNNNGEEEDDVGAESKDVVSGVLKHAAKTTGEEHDANNSHDDHVSFVLCLYPDGYTIEKASEGEVAYPVEVPKNLHPYDRASESLFSAIESGRLLGDILDDIPCKYINGKLVCEVRDYRKCFIEGVNASSLTPITNKLRLRMSLENVVKDIPLMSDNDWTYGDLMKVESRILKALQPKLCLDPKPKLDRLCYNPKQNEVNFGISSMRKRSSHIAEITTTPSSNIRGKKVCIGRVPESSMLVDSENMLHPSDIENLQSRYNGQLNLLDQMTNNTSGPLSLSPLVAHPSKHQMDLGIPRLGSDYRLCSALNPQVEALNSVVFSCENKRDGQEGQNMPLQQPLLVRRLQYGNSGLQKYPHQVLEGWLNQEIESIISTQGMRYAPNKEHIDYEGMDIIELAQSLRSNAHQEHLNSKGHPLGVPQSPLSSTLQIGKPFILRSSSANYLNQNRTMNEDGSADSVRKFGFSRNVSIPCDDKSTKSYVTLMDRFSKIDTASVRYQSNREKDKAVEQALIKSKVFSSEHLLNHLSTDSRSESYVDDPCLMPLSKSLVDGSMNVCKARVLNFKQPEPINQGNSFLVVPKLQTRLIMSEKSNDGSVAMHMGEIEDSQYLADYLLTLSSTGELLQSLDNIYDIKIENSRYMDAEDYLPTLPNTVDFDTHIKELIIDPSFDYTSPVQIIEQ